MNDTDGYAFCRSYMTDQEYILWKGRPEKGNIFYAGEMIMILFGAVWLIFSLYWELSVMRTSGSWFLVLWGIPFVAVGIYLTVGRFFQRAYTRKHTFYVITNRKIVIRKGNRIEIHDADKLPAMDIVFYKNGCGTIRFIQNFYTGQSYRRGTCLKIENIADVKQAQNAISMMEK